MRLLLVITFLLTVVVAASAAAAVQATDVDPDDSGKFADRFVWLDNLEDAEDKSGQAAVVATKAKVDADAAVKEAPAEEREEKEAAAAAAAEANAEAHRAAEKKSPPMSLTSACVTNQRSFNAYGFYKLVPGGGEVKFGVYSRVQYYALTPEWDGNLVIPAGWNGQDVTRAAHRQGSKADLVISNDKWLFEHGTAVDPSYDFEDGLWLTKSFVLLTLIDDIADAVAEHGFDGVTIDFRLPSDVDTIESFTFFVNRLKKRLDVPSRRSNDLLKPEDKKLNLVIDNVFVSSLAGSSALRETRLKIIKDLDLTEADSMRIVEDLSPADLLKVISGHADSADILKGVSDASLRVIKKGQPEYDYFYAGVKGDVPNVLGQMFGELFDSVDLWFVDRPNKRDEGLELNVKLAITENGGDPKKNMAIILPRDPTFELDKTRVGIWDVADTQESEHVALSDEVFNGSRPMQSISDLVCARRVVVLNTLTGAAPFFLVMLALSWVIYDFPKIVKKSISNLVLWGLLGLVFVVFLLLIIGLPSRDLGDTRVYVVAASFAVPIIYIVWNVLTKLGRKDYP